MTTMLAGFLLLVGSYAGVEAVRRYAIRRRVLDVPNPRSSHTVPTPRGGGIVIVRATLLSLGAAIALRPIALSPPLLSYVLGGVVVAAVGWLDDVRGLSSGVRLVAHATAAALLLLGAGWWQTADLPLAGPVALGWVAIPLALLWIVGMTNAYNFMDGIDGIAGVQAVVAGAVWAIIGATAASPAVTVVGLGVALSSSAFLLHNWSPARIFMGDAGSGFLGFTFAALPFVILGTAGPEGRLLRLPVAAALLVWPFVFDALFTVIRRLIRRERVLQPHRSHLYQRLVLAGLGHRSVAALYAGLALAGAALALAWLRGSPGSSLAVAVGLPGLAMMSVGLVAALESQVSGRRSKVSRLTTRS